MEAEELSNLAPQDLSELMTIWQVRLFPEVALLAVRSAVDTRWIAGYGSATGSRLVYGKFEVGFVEFHNESIL